MIDTNVFYSVKELGKNLYRKKTYYTLVVEQEVLASDKDEADRLLMDCGIDHSEINARLAETKHGVETCMVDADYKDTDPVEFIGKVIYQDIEFAKENGDVMIDPYAQESTTTKETA